MKISYLIDSFTSLNTHSSIAYNCVYFVSLCFFVIVYISILFFIKTSSIDKKRVYMDMILYGIFYGLCVYFLFTYYDYFETLPGLNKLGGYTASEKLSAYSNFRRFFVYRTLILFFPIFVILFLRFSALPYIEKHSRSLTTE